MIVTLTPNPSLDRAADLASPLRRGDVHRLGSPRTDPGGKGVNVARVVARAGEATCAVLPMAPGDPLGRLLDDADVPFAASPTAGGTRTNLTLTEQDGTTTKLNEPGPAVSARELDALTEVLLERARGARWVALCGSLPPGADADWYARLVPRLRDLGLQVAVDTSGEPLLALRRAGAAGAPHLLKPNVEELAQLTGADPTALEHAVRSAGPAPVAEAAAALVEEGVDTVLTTLGGEGAVLTTRDGSWHAPAPRTTVASTVGAGDASLAGYLLADLAGAAEPTRLVTAIAYGSAAAALPGTGLPEAPPTCPSTDTVRPL